MNMKAAIRFFGRWVLAAATLILLVSGCRNSRPATHDPAFDWFRYEGKDQVFSEHEAADNQYQNPILAGFYPDPSITRVGDDYYLVNSTFSYFPGVPIFHSNDLVHWTQIGSVLERPSQLKLGGRGMSRGIFAPTIRHHKGLFYLITTRFDDGGNFIVTAQDPAGPWSDPTWLPFDGIDPSIFFDDDGKVYTVNNGVPEGGPEYEGHRAIWLQQYDPEAGKMIGERSMIVNGGTDISRKPIWIEGPHLFKVNGWYYLICAEGGTAEDHSEVVFRSRSVKGPYTSYKNNPILTQRQLDPERANPVTSTGHADFVQTQNGEWWAVFLGVRPYKDNYYNTGRETFMLPVKWKDGWPVILEGDRTVPYVHKKPDLPGQPNPGIPLNGNFTLQADFDQKELAPYWEFARTPHEKWYDLESTPGWLSIKARNESIHDTGNPSFIGRRQQHANATVSTAMKYRPTQPGDRAGLVAFQNKDYYYFLAVTRDNGRPAVKLFKKAGVEDQSPEQEIASEAITLPAGGTLFLKIEAREAQYDFYYATRKGDWQLLKGGADGTILSTKKAGGFIGTMLGMYAYTGQPE